MPSFNPREHLVSLPTALKSHADVPLVYIRDILGHESVVTTEIYAKVDSLKKREVITKAFSPTIEEPNTPLWLKDADLLEWLKSL